MYKDPVYAEVITPFTPIDTEGFFLVNLRPALKFLVKHVKLLFY